MFVNGSGFAIMRLQAKSTSSGAATKSTALPSVPVMNKTTD